MFKKPNSVFSFICSFGSMAIILDYLLWPNRINVSDSTQMAVQIQQVIGVLMLLFSIFYRTKAKKIESPNGWLKASGIMNILVISAICLSLLFYIYIKFIN